MILTANSGFCVPPHFGRCKSRSQVLVRGLSGGYRKFEDVKNNGRLSYDDDDDDDVGKADCFEHLKPLWDDGYGTQNAKDFFKLAKGFSKSDDAGPPRWFCPVSCGRPLKDSPLLLYLPGLDCLGFGLLLHEKALGKVFEVRCLHIPVRNRSPFEELVQFVEEAVRLEHASSPTKPIYLVGDSFGGCLAITVAARNPTVDLVVILLNPATCFERSRLPSLLFHLESLPNVLHGALSLVFISEIRNVGDFLPKDTLIWRLKLLKSAAAYANSHLQAVTAEVLVLSSFKDPLLPSKDEAKRLKKSLQNCRICILKGNDHRILLQSDDSLLTLIKGSLQYRRASHHDIIKDYIPPSLSEYRKEYEGHRWLHLATSPVMLSTLEDGKVVTGLEGIPNDGPVLFVGNHMLLGLDLFILFLAFLKEKRIMLRGLGHPQNLQLDSESGILGISILLRVFGILPVSAINLFKLLSSKSYVLLYPGGAREALHRKGEVHKLFWPEQQEFVRMAANCGATIVPFGSVGEDDVSEMLLDYDDQMRIPGLRNHLQDLNEKSLLLRQDKEGEVANQQLHLPLVMPKIPGRFYYLFGKPIKTKGVEKILNDKEISQALYTQVKRIVETNITYLIKKRQKDPHRSFVKRVVFQAKTSTPWDKVPTFDP